MTYNCIPYFIVYLFFGSQNEKIFLQFDFHFSVVSIFQTSFLKFELSYTKFDFAHSLKKNDTNFIWLTKKKSLKLSFNTTKSILRRLRFNDAAIIKLAYFYKLKKCVLKNLSMCLKSLPQKLGLTGRLPAAIGRPLLVFKGLPTQ